MPAHFLKICSVSPETDFSILRKIASAAFGPRQLAVLSIFTTLISSAQTNYSRVVAFGPSTISGANPVAPMLEGSDGALYGTTFGGGTNNEGAIFKLNKDGTGRVVLHHFNGADGSNPFGGLILGTNGALYGTTINGGSNGFWHHIPDGFERSQLPNLALFPRRF